MPLALYNSLTRRKEVFEPIDPALVRMYVCGPTVYDLAHIGNARAVVVFDQLYRVLREIYGADHVRYARNITDIDDKIINAARESGESIDQLTKSVRPRCSKRIWRRLARSPPISSRAAPSTFRK